MLVTQVVVTVCDPKKQVKAFSLAKKAGISWFTLAMCEWSGELFLAQVLKGQDARLKYEYTYSNEGRRAKNRQDGMADTWTGTVLQCSTEDCKCGQQQKKKNGAARKRVKTKR